MNSSLLDTDTFSEILKGINVRVATLSARYLAEHGRYTTAAIAVMEMVDGLHRLRREDRIAALMAHMAGVDVLPFDLSAAELAGRIAADLRRTGQPIGRADPMIASIALSRGLTLVTGNTAHYQRIRDLGYHLELDNWRL